MIFRKLSYIIITYYTDKYVIWYFSYKISTYIYTQKVGATIIHDAAVKGHIDTIKWILHNTSLNISLKDSDGIN